MTCAAPSSVRSRASVIGISFVSSSSSPPMDLSAIKAKLTRGDLPRTDWDRPPRLTSGGRGDCVACDGPTTPVDIAVECQRAGQRVMLHPDCYVMWEEARGT